MSLAFLMGIAPGSPVDDTRKDIRGEWFGERVFFIRHQELDISARPPCHTVAGLEKIKNISLPEEIDTVICGVGSVFTEILRAIREKLPKDVTIGFSPFCGVNNYKEGKYLLEDGTLVDPGYYIGIKIPYLFNPWKMVASVPKSALFIGGGELFNSLGLEASCGKGKAILYELDYKNGTGKILQ